MLFSPKGHTWFTEGGEDGKCIGIVLIQDIQTNEYKAYIGTGDGKSEGADIMKIIKWGAKFPVDLAMKMFGIEEDA